MAKKKWTREERKKHVMEHFPGHKEKIFAVILIIIIFIVLITAIALAFQVPTDPFLLVLLIIALVVMIPIAIFLIDMAYEEPS